MTPRRGAAPTEAGAGTQAGITTTHGHRTSSSYSQGQRNAASWAVRHANLWREELDAEKRIARLEYRIAQLERLASGEQIL